MESSREDFGPECAALVSLHADDFEGGQAGRLKSLLSRADFDWARFIGESLRQKLSPLVGLVLTENDLLGLVYPGGLRAEGVPFVVRKGLLLDLQLYGGRGLRIISDLDFMVAPGDARRVTEVMQGLGFQNGNYDEQRGAVAPYTRQELITFRLSPDHLPKFVKATGDPLFRAVDVDFATSFSWARSEFDVSLEDAFSTRVDYALPHMENPIPGFSPAFQFLDTVLHCYREAYTESAIRAGNDVELRKFLDVLLLWRLHRETLEGEQFRGLLSSSGLGAPVAWVLAYTDRLFGQDLVGSLGLGGAAGEEHLSSWRASGGEVKRWGGDIRERLYAKNRRGQFLSEYGA